MEGQGELVQDVMNIRGEKVAQARLQSAVFGLEPNAHLLHEVVCWQRAKRRAGTHSTKTRALTSGGGAKPWRQKGTGHARSGSNTSPIWVGGGVAHGPHPRDYSYSVNRKARKQALCVALSARRTESSVRVVDQLDLGAIKTKAAAATLQALQIEAGAKVLLVLQVGDEAARKSFRNIDGVKIVSPRGVNVYDVLNNKYLVFTKAALDELEAGTNS